ncbi:uncharacterized protein LOC108218256 isoform X2 [Daucus carota subsp. sativus]|uniref:uncharacterized protein LOC108218256 isoform X2 n=1 Tax=Daucus carota subsp. sativus TaxID=79200 RepID=UPI003082FE7F
MDPSVFKLWPDTLILQVFVCFCCYLIMENGRQRIPLGSLSSSSARSGRKRISLAALSPSSARTGSNIAHWYLVKPLTEVMTQDFNSGTITASVGGSQGYLTPSQRRLHGEDLSGNMIKISKGYLTPLQRRIHGVDLSSRKSIGKNTLERLWQ